METLSLHPRRLSSLSITSNSDLSSTAGVGGGNTSVAGYRGGDSVGWRSPATPISMPRPDDELTCTPDELAQHSSSGNGMTNGGNGLKAAAGTTRRVTFVDETPVRLPYRRVPASTDSFLVTDIVREVEEPPVAAAATTLIKSSEADSIFAAPRRGSSLALQARLQVLKAAVESDGDDDFDGINDKGDGGLGGCLDSAAISTDHPRVADARARAANAAPGERLFVGLRRADVSAGSVDRVAVAESALATRRPPRCRPPPSLVDPPDPTELWRPEEAAIEPVDCGLSGFDAAAFLRPGPVPRALTAATATSSDSLGCVMRRWADGGHLNCYF